MNTVQAIFENGVFRPLGPVQLPNHAQVEFEPRLVTPDAAANAMRSVYEILDERFTSGETDVAARHDEHQP